MMTNAWRIIVASWKHFLRNTWIGLAMVLVFTTSLLALNTLVGVQALVTRGVTFLEDKVDVNVAFVPATPEAVVDQARFYLASLPQVADVKVVTASEALAAFRERHKKDTKILAALDEVASNPLGAQLIVKAKRTEDYAFLLAAIRHPQYAAFIQSSSFDDHAETISKLEVFGRQIRLGGAFLVALFALFALLIVFHAVRVGIYTHRDEISIMRLVGASSFFIRAPFILEGVWLAFLSLVLSTIVLAAVVGPVERWVQPLFEGMDPGLVASFVSHWQVLILFEGGGLLLFVTLISSAAVGRYIRR